MDGWIPIYIYCLPPAGGRIRSQGNYYCLPPAGVLHSQNKVIKCAAYGVAQGGGGWRYGFININDMYNNDVCNGGVRVYEAYEVK